MAEVTSGRDLTVIVLNPDEVVALCNVLEYEHPDGDLYGLAQALGVVPDGMRECDGCGRLEDAGTYPDQDGEGRSVCCWDKEDDR